MKNTQEDYTLTSPPAIILSGRFIVKSSELKIKGRRKSIMLSVTDLVEKCHVIKFFSKEQTAADYINLLRLS